MPFSHLESKFNVKVYRYCRNAGVIGNLTVTGFVMLLGSCSLARFRQSVPLSVVLLGCFARILLCV